MITHGRPDNVSVEDVGPSDHCVLRGVSYRLELHRLMYLSVCFLGVSFISSCSDLHCLRQPHEWPANVYDMAAMYDSST